MTRRYWDANCFLGWFLGEPDKLDACQSVVQAAEAGELHIVTSALTLTEVIKLKNHTSLPHEQEETIRRFFENPFIIIRNLDRRAAEHARSLIWQHDFLKPKDAVHVATALLSDVLVLDTFDGDLIGLDGRLGKPPLRIGRPNLPRQEVLDFGPASRQGEEEEDEETEDDSP